MSFAIDRLFCGDTTSGRGLRGEIWMQHETWCKNHRLPLDDTQPWTPCMGSPDAQVRHPDATGPPTEAWLTTDEGGQTVVDLAHVPGVPIPVQSAGEFGIALALMAEQAGAVLKWPDVPSQRSDQG